jgi:hypothetical protein
VQGEAGDSVLLQRTPAVSGVWKDWQPVTLGVAPVEVADHDWALSRSTFLRAVDAQTP